MVAMVTSYFIIGHILSIIGKPCKEANVCLHYRGVTFNKEHPSFLKAYVRSDNGHGSYFMEAL